MIHIVLPDNKIKLKCFSFSLHQKCLTKLWSFYHNIFFLYFLFKQIIAALAVSLGPLAAGLGKGYSSPAIASLQELQIRQRGNYTFTVTDQQASWVASLSLLGKIFMYNDNVVYFYHLDR